MFHLIDDGTLDTVVQCDECGEQLRYDSATLVEGVSAAMRVQVAIGQASEDHEECN